MKIHEFIIDGESYEMTIDELAQNVTRTFAKELLSDNDFEIFRKKQDEFFEKRRKEVEEYAKTHYIYDELRDAY